MVFYDYIYPNPKDLLEKEEYADGLIVDTDSNRGSWDTSKKYYVRNPSGTNGHWWYYSYNAQNEGTWYTATSNYMKDHYGLYYGTTPTRPETPSVEKIYVINPSRWLQIEWIPAQFDKFDDYMKDFIKNWFNFPYLRPTDTTATIDPKTVSKYQWRVAPSQAEEKDYIAYDFNHEDPKQAKAALKRALARARLETYALPQNWYELIAFYHYDGQETIGTGANAKKYYRFKFDATLQNNSTDVYNAWTFNKKIELGTTSFGSTAVVQQSYNHGEIVGFYLPEINYPSVQPFDESNFEQIITKTLACFDLGDLPVPVVERGKSIYYEYNKFSGEWKESDELYYKNGNTMINLKNWHWSEDNSQSLVTYRNVGSSEAYIYKPVKLVNW